MSDATKNRMLFDGSPTEPKTLEEVIFQAVGAGSACWDNLVGAGVFESDRAKTIADEALAYVRERIAEAWDRGYASGYSNAARRMSDEPNAPMTPNPHR